MSLQDELVKIDVEINSNSDKLADDFIETSESASKMRSEISQLEKAMGYLKSSGKDNTEQFKSFQTRLKEVKQDLHSVEGRLVNLSKVTDINSMSASQLRKRMADVRKELDSTSKSLNPDKWKELNNEFQKTKQRLGEVQAGTGLAAKAMDVFQKALPIGSANLMVKGVEYLINGIKQFAKDAVEQTQIVGDKWAMFTAGMTTAYHQFVAQISTGNWGNLFKNIAEAYREGREIQALTDELFEMNNSLSIEAAKLTRENKEQERIMKDVTKSEKERLAAGNKIIENENKVLQIKKDIAKQELEAAVIGLESRTKMSEADRQYFIDNYNSNRTAIKQAEKLLELEAAYSGRSNIRAQMGARGYSDTESERLQGEIGQFRTANPEAARAAGIMQKYNMANDPLIDAYVKATEKLINADSEFYQATMKTATRTAALRKEIAEGTRSAAEKAYQNELNLAAKKSREETNQLKEQYSSGVLTKEQYNSRMTAATQELYRKQIAIAARYGQDTTELESKLYDAAIARREELNKASTDGYKTWLKEIQKEFERTMSELQKQETAEIEKLYESISNESGKELAAKLKAAMDINANYGDTDSKLQAAENTFDLEMQQLEELHDMQYISEEAYQEKKKELIERYTKECVKIETAGWQKGFQAAQQYLNSASALSSALQEAESASLDARMQAELTAAGNNADERAAIEERYEAEKLEIEKKYANIDMGIQIAQAIANGALAITQCFATMPTPAAIAMSVVLAATTAAQVATIIAQRNAIMNSSASGSSSTTSQRMVTGAGYSEGGYTGDGGRLEPAGIVHRGEYVVPMPEMRNPAVISRVREIEAIRTQRTSAHRMPGFAEGGYTDAGASGQDTNMMLVQAIRELRSSPMKAYVVLSELQAKQDLTNSLKQAASR